MLPSHAYETLGKTILESYAQRAGRGGHGPGVAAGAGASTARQDFCTGWEMWSNWRRRSSFSAHSRNWRNKWDGRAGSRCERKYTPEAHYEALIGLYRAADLKRESSSHARNASKAAKDRPGKVSVGCGAASDSRLRSGAASRFDPACRRQLIPASSFRNGCCAWHLLAGGGGSKYSGIETYYEEVGQATDAGWGTR